jgi:hypothetical protein
LHSIHATVFDPPVNLDVVGDECYWENTSVLFYCLVLTNGISPCPLKISKMIVYLLQPFERMSIKTSQISLKVILFLDIRKAVYNIVAFPYLGTTTFINYLYHLEHLFDSPFDWAH